VPIDIERVVGAELLELRTSWTPDDVILYHLGLGAGTSPIDAGELSYLYEGGLKVLPSYGVVPVLPALTDMLALRGMDVDLATLLHGEQDLEIHAELPAAAEVSTAARVTDVFDKGRAALVVLETVTTTTDTRPRRLFTNRFRAFIRGEGGFGGDTGPSETLDPPAREPDHVTEHSTLPAGAAVPTLGRQEPDPCRPRLRTARRLRPPDPARSLQLRHRLQGSGGRGPRRESRTGRALPGALRGRRVPGGDHRRVDVGPGRPRRGRR
jgi:hypothetical protein